MSTRIQTNSFAKAESYRLRSLQNRRKRTRQLRIRMAILAIVLIAIFVLSGVFGSFIAKAETNNHETAFKYYTSITIPYGSTLLDMAQDYMGDSYESAEKYIDEVIAINHLQNPDQIKAGEILIFPYFSTEFK